MKLNFSPKFAQRMFEGEGGTYYSWSSTEYELLKEAKVGGGRLVLQPRGFAFPHYADSNKIGYVLQGLSTLLSPPPSSFLFLILSWFRDGLVYTGLYLKIR